MKKSLLFLASGALLMTSCSDDNTTMQAPDGGGNVNFTVAMPANGYGSRVFADGYTATDLVYAVYDASNDALVSQGDATFAADSRETTVSLQLANGKGYKIAFFAHKNDHGVYTFDAENKEVSVDYTKMADYNVTDYDAFYAVKEIVKVTGPINETVTLTRPLAQVNWGTNDLANEFVTAPDAYDKDADNKAKNLVSKVEISGVYSAFDLLTGEVKGEAATVTFDEKARPVGETFPVANYEYMSMNYILVPSAQSSLVEAILTPSNGTTASEAVKVANMPVQANYRTNVYGSLLTVPGEFTVVKDHEWAGGDFNNGYKAVSTAEELTAAIEAGVPVKLAEDIALSDRILVARDKVVTLDLNGHTLSSQGRAIDCNPGTVLTINDNTGKGIISAKEEYTIISDGKVIINGGTIVNNGFKKEDGRVQDYNVIYGCPDGLEINGGIIGSKDMVGNCIHASGDIVINDGTLLNAGSYLVASSLINIGKGTNVDKPISTLTINGGTFGYDGYGGIIIAGGTFYDVKIHGGKFYGGGHFKPQVFVPDEDVTDEVLEEAKNMKYPLFTYTPNYSFHYYIDGGEFYGSDYMIADGYNGIDNKSHTDAATITGGQWQVGDLDAYLTDGQTKTEAGEYNGKPVYAVSK